MPCHTESGIKNNYLTYLRISKRGSDYEATTAYDSLAANII